MARKQRSDKGSRKPVRLDDFPGIPTPVAVTVGYRDVSAGKVKRREFPGVNSLPNGWHDSMDKCNNTIELD